MPARAFIDSDEAVKGVLVDVERSKCPRGHLLILMFEKDNNCEYFSALSKCPRGHLLILMPKNPRESPHPKSLNAREGIY